MSVLSEAPAAKPPVLYPAISSLRARAPLLDHLHVLRASGFGRLLISAYDIATNADEDKSAIRDVIDDCQRAGFEVMLDSGGYEAFWRGDDSWSQSRYDEIAKDLRGTLNLGFDYPQPTNPDERDALNHARHGSDIAAKAGTATTVIPIVHSARASETVAVEVCRSTGTTWIAVPEKQLGNGILERSARLASLRSRLNSEIDPSVRIHVLGAGSPRDIGIYAASGADSFDGLEWSRCYIDAHTLRCENAAYWELLDHEGWRQRRELGWFMALALHNLIALQDWMESLRAAFEGGRLAQLVTARFPELGES